jgi:hypothetical protein
MHEGFQLATMLLGFAALAAVLLWTLEGATEKFGTRFVWLVMLVVLPLLAGASYALINREELEWWKVIGIPLATPLVWTAFLAACLALVKPSDAIALLGTAFKNLRRRGWPRAGGDPTSHSNWKE